MDREESTSSTGQDFYEKGNNLSCALQYYWWLKNLRKGPYSSQTLKIMLKEFEVNEVCCELQITGWKRILLETAEEVTVKRASGTLISLKCWAVSCDFFLSL